MSNDQRTGSTDGDVRLGQISSLHPDCLRACGAKEGETREPVRLRPRPPLPRGRDSGKPGAVCMPDGSREKTGTDCRRATCAWVQQDDGADSWKPSCRHYCTIEGSPSDNGMKYCCYCGKSLEEVPFSAPESDEED